MVGWGRKANLENRKKIVSEQPWRPANPAKKDAGNLSSHYGTVGYEGKKTPAFPVGGRIEYTPSGWKSGLKKGDVEFVRFLGFLSPIILSEFLTF